MKGPFLVLAVSIVGFAISRRAMTHLGQWSELASFFAVIAACCGAVALSGIRYSDMTAALRITMQWIGIFVFIQMLFDAFGPFPGPPNILFGDHPPLLYFRYAAILGVAVGAAAFWRPSFLIPLFLYYVGWRELVGTLSGVSVDTTDYLGMVDAGYFSTVGTFIAIGATAPWTLERFPFLRTLASDTEGRESTRQIAFGLIWACAVGAHLGSYFWSGMMKIHVGGNNPLTWVLHNPTQTSILIGLERGDNPLSLWPSIVQGVWDAIAGGLPFLNLFVLATQLLSPFAAISAPVLSIFCLLFDLFHIGVYLTLGALFFFWIGTNLVIVAAAASLPRGGFSPAMKIVMGVTVVLGHFVFYTNYLGWLDAAKLATTNFYAITRDGREVAVPSNYFGIYSYTIAQTALYVPDDHFRFRLGGNNHNMQMWQDARTCGSETLAHQETGVSLGAVKDLVRHVDTLMRIHPAVKDYNLYYFYPYHMVPNPWMFTPFNDLPIEDIVAYKYVVESVCLSLKDGKLDRDVHKESDFRIDLP
jgi:hypothetical protein